MHAIAFLPLTMNRLMEQGEIRSEDEPKRLKFVLHELHMLPKKP